MKKLLFGIALLVSGVSNGQQISTADSMKYAVAYNYILSDSVGVAHTIIPSNELTSTSYEWFREALEFSNNKAIKNLTADDYKTLPPELKLSQEQKDELLRHYKAIQCDEGGVKVSNPNYTFPPSYKDYNNEQFILYFSPINDNEFFVELNNGGFMWGHSHIYFFLLNEDNTINKVYSKIINYN